MSESAFYINLTVYNLEKIKLTHETVTFELIID